MATAPNNLRPDVNAFVGRERELVELVELFSRGARLVSLLGPPGIGKTRLARRFGQLALVADRYPGGVWFVDLTESRNSSELTAAVALAAGVRLGPDLPGTDAQLAADLEEKGRALLVLDNFESWGSAIFVRVTATVIDSIRRARSVALKSFRPLLAAC